MNNIESCAETVDTALYRVETVESMPNVVKFLAVSRHMNRITYTKRIIQYKTKPTINRLIHLVPNIS